MTYETLTLDQNGAVLTGAFQTYSLSRTYRLDQSDNTTAGAARARRRDAAFGDNR